MPGWRTSTQVSLRFSLASFPPFTDPISTASSATTTLAGVAVFSASSGTATPAAARHSLAEALTLFSAALQSLRSTATATSAPRGRFDQHPSPATARSG